METEPAREQAVAVGVVQDHPRLRARHRQRTGVDAREEVDVGGGVADDGELSGRPGGSVDADDLLARNGEHAERIGVAKVVLTCEREMSQIVQRRDVARLDVREPIPVERDSILDAADQRSEPFDLKRP